MCARDEPDNPKPPAIEGLLRVHRQLVEGVEGEVKEPLSEETLKGTITARLLVPATQAGSLIGRQGSTIKGFQETSGANIRVLPHGETQLGRGRRRGDTHRFVIAVEPFPLPRVLQRTSPCVP